jgi:signal transduction histidine kinase
MARWHLSKWRPFVLDVASEIESLVSEKSLSLSLVMGAALPRIRTDPTHLRQILVNLLGNAVKYTNEGGIVIRTRLVDSLPDSGTSSTEKGPYPSNPWIGIQVIDTGIGIHPADQTRIFEEFEQIDAGPRGNSAERGTGLGLAISRRLASLIGGMVELESEPGKGSTFTLWLPVDPEDLSATPKYTLEFVEHFWLVRIDVSSFRECVCERDHARISISG